MLLLKLPLRRASHHNCHKETISLTIDKWKWCQQQQDIGSVLLSFTVFLLARILNFVGIFDDFKSLFVFLNLVHNYNLFREKKDKLEIWYPSLISSLCWTSTLYQPQKPKYTKHTLCIIWKNIFRVYTLVLCTSTSTYS